MEHEKIWTNGLISIGWYDTRLDVLDSDNLQIDYLFDYSSYEEYEQEEIIQDFKKQLEGCNEEETCKKIAFIFDCIKEIVPLSENTTIEQLREEYGKEWVNRVGNTALIIKE